MINLVFKFIKNNFDKMPEWLQISTFIFFLSTFGVLLFTPKFIDIRMLGKVSGNDFPIVGAIVVVEGSGRVFRMVTDSQGRLSVPVSLANPLSEYTFVLYPDPDEEHTEDLIVSGVRAYSSKWNKLYFYDDERGFEFEAALDFNLFSTAFADNNTSLFIGGQVDQVNDNVLIDDVKSAISEIKKYPIENIGLDLKLKEELSLTNYDLSYISYKLGEKYSIEPWRNYRLEASTVADLVEITKVLNEKKLDWGEYLTLKNQNSISIAALAKTPATSDIDKNICKESSSLVRIINTPQAKETAIRISESLNAKGCTVNRFEAENDCEKTHINLFHASNMKLAIWIRNTVKEIQPLSIHKMYEINNDEELSICLR